LIWELLAPLAAPTSECTLNRRGVANLRRFRVARAAMSKPVPECDVDVLKVILDEGDIAAKVSELGAKIAQDYKDLKPILLPVMTGAFVFSADLVRAIRPPPQGMRIESLRASSYLGTTTLSNGEVAIAPLSIDVKGQHVLLVEDIIDTGHTLEKICTKVMGEGAASCKVVALLNKRERRENGLQPEYEGFDCPNEFVIGYGLDFDSKYRELPYVGVLKEELYAHIL